MLSNNANTVKTHSYVIWDASSYFSVINPKRVGGLGYSSLSVCLCVCVRASVAQFGLPGDLGITICT